MQLAQLELSDLQPSMRQPKSQVTILGFFTQPLKELAPWGLSSHGTRFCLKSISAANRSFLRMSFDGILHRSGLELDFFVQGTPVIFREEMG